MLKDMETCMYKDAYIQVASRLPLDFSVDEFSCVQNPHCDENLPGGLKGNPCKDDHRDFKLSYVLCIYTVALCVCCVNEGTPQLWCVCWEQRESEDNLGDPVLSFHVGYGGLNSDGQTS